jgi:hypothetical protein
MIECPVCKKQYKKLVNAHIKIHGYFNFKSFGVDYPKTKLLNDIIYKTNGQYNLTASLKTIQERKDKSIKQYLKNPKYCLSCTTVIPYDKKQNNFCNHSCSATYLNPRREYVLSKKGLENIKISNLKRKKSIVKQFDNVCTVCNIEFISLKTRKKTCSDICRKRSFSNNAKKNKLGGNHNKNAFWYISPIAGKVWLESSYERKVAEELDFHNIKWERPKFTNYKDDIGEDRKYYGDFYLKEYKVYLDPKNNFLQIQDKRKIEIVQQQNNIKVVVLNKNELTWDIIKTKIT